MEYDKNNNHTFFAAVTFSFFQNPSETEHHNKHIVFTF